MPSPITVTAVENRWRPLTDPEALVATTLLADAWALLNRRDSSIAARYTAGSLDHQLVAQVLAEMVVRVLQNPEQVRSRQETVGPFTTSTSLQTGDGRGRLVVTDEELELLAAPAAAGGAFSISLLS